jgi:hypothetical protein
MIANETVNAVALRELFEQTHSAAAVLKVITATVPGSVFEWAQQMRMVFNLSLPELKSIGGWEPDGTGELNDARLDAVLVPAIERRRNDWAAR